MFKRVLMATDLEKGSEGMIRSVTGLLEGCSTEQVLLFHVLDERALGEQKREEEKKALLERQGDLLRQRGSSVECSLDRGVPFDAIIHQAESWKATAVVLGPGKAPSWATSWMGSTTLRILELCPLPVMTCPEKSFPKEPSRDVMIGMDFSNHAVQAYESLLEFLRECRGSFQNLTLVHIHEQTNVDLLLKVVGEDQIDALIDVERSRLEKMARQAEEAGVQSVEILMETGKTIDRLLDIAGKKSPGLLVLGAQGQGVSDKYKIGKVAYRLSHMAPCPVLVVPLPRKGFPL